MRISCRERSPSAGNTCLSLVLSVAPWRPEDLQSCGHKREVQLSTDTVISVDLSLIYIQWNLSKLDTTGTAEESVLNNEVSSFQGLFSMQMGYLGAGKTVLFMEVSSIRGCHYREVPLWYLGLAGQSLPHMQREGLA